MLTVTDTGIGMTSEVSNRVFEPFFHHPRPRAWVLGLSTVYSIVRQCGGDIYVYSEPDRGTTFKVYLPRIDDAEVTTSARDTVPDAVRGYETILVVEDDYAVRDLTSEVLIERGYHGADGHERQRGARGVERPPGRDRSGVVGCGDAG